jgi:hypothetical protein
MVLSVYTKRKEPLDSHVSLVSNATTLEVSSVMSYARNNKPFRGQTGTGPLFSFCL